MQDVANRAGVSIGTVSNTINSPEKVRKSTREKVLQAIDDLGFVRNDAARHLAAGVSTTIGLIIVDMANSLFVDIARGAEAAVRERGMNLLVANSDVDEAKQTNYFHVFEQARVAGILLAPLDTPDIPIARPRTIGQPMVLANLASPDGAYSSAVADERLGGYLAAEHLIEIGRRHLVFAGGPEWLHAVHDRLAGARDAVAAHPGVTLEFAETTGLNVRHGRQIGNRVVAGDFGTVDGVVAASDLVAVGCIQVLELAEDFAVPSRVAVVGYDNNHFASESATPVSTISQPGELMGRMAAEMLLEEIEGGGVGEKRNLVLPPHLVVRRSTVAGELPHTTV